jgi:parallel beta helix pectate lyase-like protein/disaggregatase-related protein
MENPKRQSIRVSAGIFWAILAIFTTTAGGTIYVDDDQPADFNTIQAAIDFAVDGNEIVVKDGTYTGAGNRDIEFKGKAITVRSENGPASCIIDCQGSETEPHLGFYFHGAEGPDSILDGFTITHGYHEQAGGIFCTYVAIGDWRPSNPTIQNCVITNNWGKYAGAIYCQSHCEPLISNCIISENVGAYMGGIYYSDMCHPVLTNCIIQNNRGAHGGGIRTGGAQCHGTITNCVISGNRSTNGGAAVNWWSAGGSVTITNCTIVSNEDEYCSGGIYIGGGGGTTGTITNCIIRDNRVQGGLEDQISLWMGGDLPTTAEVTYCNVQGGWPGEGNIDADPFFVDADGADDAMGTDDDNLRLLGGSPCLDTGDNSAVSGLLITDIEGNPRIVNGTVDMGAYEGPNQGLVVRPLVVTVGEGQSAGFTVELAMDPNASVEVTSAVTSGDPDITISSGAVLPFDSFNYDQPRTVELAAAEDEDYINGSAVVSVIATGFSTITIGVNEAEVHHVLYVDTDAPGNEKGTSWAEAFLTLQDALAAARLHSHLQEIRVAQGAYQPDQGAGQTPGDRTASFELVNDILLKGGYAGFGTPDPNARDIRLYETILSGDLNGDDAPVVCAADLLDEPSRAENSYHVVKGFYFPDCHHDVTAELDGFTIQDGNANRTSDEWTEDLTGGGMLHEYVRGLKIANCTFRNNTAHYGGAMYGSRGPLVNCVITNNAAKWSGGGLEYCTGQIQDCTLEENYAGNSGGAVYLWGGDPRLQIERCTFRRNYASSGGGLFFADTDPVLVDCTLADNEAYDGGAIYAAHFDNPSYPTLTGCVLRTNSAERYGGAILCSGSDMRVARCIWQGNNAEDVGGAIACYDGSEVRMTNCTFYENSAPQGNALAYFSSSLEYPYPNEVHIVNSIFRDGGDELWTNDSSQISIRYSDVQGGWLGQGVIDVNPLFIDPDVGDFHLKSQAGRWDPVSQTWVQDDMTSPCIDAGDPATPIGWEPFPNGGIVNMGAYGGTNEASKSYFGKPNCETPIAGDINGDCIVDMRDLAIMANHWLEDKQ